MIGTGLAIGLAAAASVGSQVYSAHTQSKAAKDAAKAQTRGADRAMGALDSALGPWVRKGQETASTLGRLTAAPPGARFAAPDPTLPRAQPNQAVPLGAGRMGLHNYDGRGESGGMPVGARPRPGGPGGPMMPPGQQPDFRRGTIGGLAPSGPSAPQIPTVDGNFIPMRAPDGTVQRVPTHLVQRALQAGAQLVQ